jgi:hypothetical protein
MSVGWTFKRDGKEMDGKDKRMEEVGGGIVQLEGRKEGRTEGTKQGDE